MSDQMQKNFWQRSGFALVSWSSWTLSFGVLFPLSGWLSCFVTRPKSVGGDAGALTMVGFIPYFMLVGLVYLAVSIWSLAAAWRSQDFQKHLKNVFTVAICCGVLFGCGFAVVARMLFGAD